MVLHVIQQVVFSAHSLQDMGSHSLLRIGYFISRFVGHLLATEARYLETRLRLVYRDDQELQSEDRRAEALVVYSGQQADHRETSLCLFEGGATH